MAIDLSAVKARQRDTWSSGDFSIVANGVTIVGELLCDAIPLLAGRRVLDIAAGSGNTSLAAARRGCSVVGSDYVPALLDRGRERAAAERLPLEFVVGDAEALPFDAASFDVVLSTFGIMFAPDQARAAAEALRVCRPGGTLAFASWTPEGFIGDVFRATAGHVPPPPGLASPFRWGTESSVNELLGSGVSAVRCTKRDVYFRDRSLADWVAFMRTFYGPTLRAFAALDAAGAAALERDLIAVGERLNRSGDATMLVPGEYLEVVATRS